MSVLKIENLEKSFQGRRVLAIEEYNFSAGDQVLLLGSNGAGKSTLLKILAGILLPEKGRIQYRSKDKCISFYESDFLFFDDLTVKEHFTFLSKLTGKSESKDSMHAMGLAHVAESSAKTLSKGWKTRLGLGLAFQQQSDLLLLDEPLDGLDDDGKESFFKAYTYYRSLNPQAISIIATHKPDEYRSFISHSLYIRNGQLEEANG